MGLAIKLNLKSLHSKHVRVNLWKQEFWKSV